MSLDENDGSDMELDSDTSPERYYDDNETVTTYNQCSKQSNSSNTNENKDKSLYNDKKIFSSSNSPQNKNSSLESPDDGSDHMNEFGTKSPVNPTISSKTYNVPPQPPFNFQKPKLPPWPLPENTMNILPQPPSSSSVSNTSLQVTLTLNTTPTKQTNGFFLKSPMTKSPTKNNVSNEPTPLELKHDRIRFELKSTGSIGYKNRLLSQIDKQSANTSAKTAKNIFNVNNNVDMMNAYDTNLDKVSTFMNKSLSLSAKVSNAFHNRSGKVKPECNDDDKRLIDDKFEEVVENHVAEEKKSHNQIVIENSLGIVEINSVEIKKNLNQQRIDNNSSELIKEDSVVVEKNPEQQQDQLVNNNFTDENSEKNNEKQEQVIDDNLIVAIEKDQFDDDNFTVLVENSVILKKGQDQEKNQIDDDSKIQETNLDILQEEKAKEILQNTEVQPENVDVVDEPLDLKQDITGNDTVITVDGDMDIDNDDNKSTEEYPSLSTINTEEDKSDIMELDQVNIMSEQDHKNKDENITSKTEKSEIASSEEMENETKKDETVNIQDTPMIKDKGKKVAAIPAVKITSQAVVSSSQPAETDSQVPDTGHLDHLTNLMTQFTNQINETSRQTNQYNSLESQSSQMQKQINDMAACQSTIRVTKSPQPVKIVEETINANDLSDEIIEKYHKLDTILLEFDEVAKKAICAYDELQRLLPEGTVIRIDPPTTYKWDMITNMLGITDVNRLEKYNLSQDDNENKGKNNSNVEKVDIENEENAREEGTSSETEYDEDMDVPSDDPDDKNFKCRSTILKQPNPKRWHNTRSNRPPSANLRQRTKVDPDSSNISTTPTTSNSSSKKKQPQTSSKRTLRTRKGEDEEDDNTTTSSSRKHFDPDKYYEDGKPRRPANGFSYFCGDMCAKVRNEKLPISGTIAYAAEIWKKMSNEEKRPWLVRGEKSKSEYQDLLIRWKEEQEELKNSGIKRTVSPKAQSVFSYKKPRKDEQK